MTENGSRGAKRCLFGRDDRSKLRDDLDKKVKEEEKAAAEAFTKKWNFEIGTETPLEGRYVWEKIEGKTETMTSTSVSHLPSADTPSASTDPDVTAKVENPESKESDSTLSSNEDQRVSSSASGTDDVNTSSYSSDEKDVNQNVVQESTKRKASNALTRDETIKEAKRAKPP